MPMVPYGAHSLTPKMHGNLADVAPPIKKGLSERLAGVEGAKAAKAATGAFRQFYEEFIRQWLTVSTTGG